MQDSSNNQKQTAPSFANNPIRWASGPFPRRHSPDGATTHTSDKQAYYSFIDPRRMKGQVGLVGWPVGCSEGFTHMVVSGHPLVAGRVQDTVTSPAKDRRSANDLRRFSFSKGSHRQLYYATNLWTGESPSSPSKLRYRSIDRNAVFR